MKKDPLKAIRSHVPSGRELPVLMSDFARAESYVRIQWHDLDEFQLAETAVGEILPFGRLPDGSVIAIWYRDDLEPIVYFGSEGERSVVAVDFDDFLKRINAKSTGIYDLDEDSELMFPQVEGKPKRKSLTKLTTEFEQWEEQHTSRKKPSQDLETQALRLKAEAIAMSMLRDGLSKVYSPDSEYWSMDFRIHQKKKGLRLEYLDYGKWYEVPERYELKPLVMQLLGYVANKDRPVYEMLVGEGILSINKDEELAILSDETIAMLEEAKELSRPKKKK